MYLTNGQRFRKLFFNLAINPKHLIRYFKYSLSKKSPLELGLPWWSYKGIDLLIPNLSRDKMAFEWGSGGSTIFLSKYLKKIIAVENNPKWVKKVDLTLNSLKVNNVDLLYKEIDLNSPKLFLESSYSKSINQEFDIIVVDGEDHYGFASEWSARENCFEISQNHIRRNGGIIIVDDSWRYPQIRNKSKAKNVIKCESTGPCRIGVTSTDLHFY